MKYLPLVILLTACSTPLDYDNYGVEISPNDALSVDALLSQAGHEGLNFKVEGVIEEVCQMKGCWMTLRNESGSTIRVTFKDYGYFVPKDISGKMVIVQGEAVRETIDEEEARHYAEDGNLEYDESMRNSVSIVATGVLVEKT